jgi:ubiquinone/menaquinone biosynthesis C-methylase UbiE
MEDQTQKEFTRQAKQMAAAAAFQARPVLEWLVGAAGSSASDRVLDLACGPGIVAEAMAPHVRQLVGIDVTPEMTRLARERLEKAHLTNGRFGVASAEALPFEGKEFDQIITRLSFHHFPDVRAVLSEIRRVLRPRGRLIIADVVSSEESEESTLHNSLEQLRDPTHVRMITPGELRQFVRLAGFILLRDERWQQPRTFTEWAEIIANPARTEPLRNVMRALARAGQGAGISLREESGELLFTHSWMLLLAETD